MPSINEKIIYTEREIVRQKKHKIKKFFLKKKLKILNKKLEKEWLDK